MATLGPDSQPPAPEPAAADGPPAPAEAAPSVDSELMERLDAPGDMTPSAGPAPTGEPAPSEVSQGPDCSAARDLRDRICELSDAICALAARSDAAPETAASCDSARTSCDHARVEVARTCPK